MASNKQKKAEIGYKVYLASFAVMLIIIIAAVCILSGCLDHIIFRAEPQGTDATPDTDTSTVTDTDKAEITVPSDTEPAPVSETEEPDTEKTGETETSKDTESEKTPDTTKSQDTDKPADTEKVTDTDKAPETEEPDDPKIDEKEVITDVDNNLKCKYANKSLTITGYVGNAAKISIAKVIDGVNVYAVGEGAFDGHTGLTEVRISSGISSIMANAMSRCVSLTDVYIPTTVTNIASDAFDGSDNVTIHCASGSYAEQYAIANNINYVNS